MGIVRGKKKWMTEPLAPEDGLKSGTFRRCRRGRDPARVTSSGYMRPDEGAQQTEINQFAKANNRPAN